MVLKVVIRDGVIKGINVTRVYTFSGIGNGIDLWTINFPGIEKLSASSKNVSADSKI